LGAAIRRSASMARSARCSCTKPKRTANSTMTVMATASTPCPRKAERTVATRRTTIKTFLNCWKRIVHGEMRWEALSSFGPHSVNRRAASVPVRPAGVDWRPAHTSATERVCPDDLGDPASDGLVDGGRSLLATVSTRDTASPAPERHTLALAFVKSRGCTTGALHWLLLSRRCGGHPPCAAGCSFVSTGVAAGHWLLRGGMSHVRSRVRSMARETDRAVRSAARSTAAWRSVSVSSTKMLPVGRSRTSIRQTLSSPPLGPLVRVDDLNGDAKDARGVPPQTESEPAVDVGANGMVEPDLLAPQVDLHMSPPFLWPLHAVYCWAHT
jgi:hypothetical protein